MRLVQCLASLPRRHAQRGRSRFFQGRREDGCFGTRSISCRLASLTSAPIVSEWLRAKGISKARARGMCKREWRWRESRDNSPVLRSLSSTDEPPPALTLHATAAYQERGIRGGLLRGKSTAQLSPMARRCARRMPQKETGEALGVATVGIALGGRGLSEATQNMETTRCLFRGTKLDNSSSMPCEKKPCPAEVDLAGRFQATQSLGLGFRDGKNIDRQDTRRSTEAFGYPPPLRLTRLFANASGAKG